MRAALDAGAFDTFHFPDGMIGSQLVENFGAELDEFDLVKVVEDLSELVLQVLDQLADILALSLDAFCAAGQGSRWCLLFPAGKAGAEGIDPDERPRMHAGFR